MTRLPAPDEYGNFWLGLRAHAPCVLTIKGDWAVKEGKCGKWMAMTRANGETDVILDANGSVRAFDSAQEALREIERRSR